ncbi:MAG: hypothetical protein KBT00_08010 [Bacteroidales bacterium]|nr:hypothetical protein [Candidatus Cacconaster merdequi]
MKRFFGAILTLALVLGAASCDNKELAGKDNDEQTPEVAGGLVMTGTIDNGEASVASKVNGEWEIDGTTGKGKVQPEWEIGDIIYGHDVNCNYELKYKVAGIDEEGVAYFFWAGEGAEPAILENTNVRMFYMPYTGEEAKPWTKNNAHSYIISFYDQDGSLHSALKHAYMIAEGTVKKDQTTNRKYVDLRFSNKTSLFKVSGLKYPDGTPVPEGTTIKLSAEAGFAMSAILNSGSAGANLWVRQEESEPRYLALNAFDEDGTICSYFAQPCSESWGTGHGNAEERIAKGIAGMGLTVTHNGNTYFCKDYRETFKKVASLKCYNFAKDSTLREIGEKVDDDDEVIFSPGNLQYRKYFNTVSSTWEEQWRFAPNSIDIIGEDNVRIEYIKGGYAYNYDDGAPESSMVPFYEGWIDLFSYGTSGYDNGDLTAQPYLIGFNYPAYPNFDLTGDNKLFDWGQYLDGKDGRPAIYVVDEKGNYVVDEHLGEWRLMTHAEWEYLINRDSKVTVSGYSSKMGLCAIFNKEDDYNDAEKYRGSIITGTVILPDVFMDPKTNFKNPSGLFKPRSEYPADAFLNSYTLEGWKAMEDAGAVFLPSAGERVYGKTLIDNVQYLCSFLKTEQSGHYPIGCYWSSNLISKGNANSAPVVHGMYFTTAAFMENHQYSAVAGASVRLVRNVNKEQGVVTH